MELDRVAIFVNNFHEKVKSGVVKWDKYSSNAYSTILGRFKISIIETYPYEDIGEFADPDYSISISRVDGDAWVDSYNDEELKEFLPHSFKIMKSIYASARRSANGAAEVVDELIKELDKKQDSGGSLI